MQPPPKHQANLLVRPTTMRFVARQASKKITAVQPPEPTMAAHPVDQEVSECSYSLAVLSPQEQALKQHLMDLVALVYN